MNELRPEGSGSRNYTALFVGRTDHDDHADTSSVEAARSASLKMRHLAAQTLTILEP
jgi:hypothetical protein